MRIYNLIAFVSVCCCIISCSKGPDGQPSCRDDHPQSSLSPKVPATQEYPGSLGVERAWEKRKESLTKKTNNSLKE